MHSIRTYSIFSLIVLVLVVSGVYLYRAGQEATAPYEEAILVLAPAESPLSATYRIEETEVTVVDGYSEREIVPGSASKATTRVLGQPVYGDLSENGENDAALILTYSEGGSGTFYYIAAAVGNDEKYLGTNAILLGDRITPEDVRIQNGLLQVQYFVHATGQAMSEEPTTQVTRYFTLSGATIQEVGLLGENEQLLSGELVYGHESRTFTSCDGTTYWLSPESRALAALEAIYMERSEGGEPYESVFVVVTGTEVAPPTEGFGADYEGAVSVTRVVRAPESGSCGQATPSNAPQQVEE